MGKMRTISSDAMGNIDIIPDGQKYAQSKAPLLSYSDLYCGNKITNNGTTYEELDDVVTTSYATGFN